jgi:hypothetical protein
MICVGWFVEAIPSIVQFDLLAVSRVFSETLKSNFHRSNLLRISPLQAENFTTALPFSLGMSRVD